MLDSDTVIVMTLCVAFAVVSYLHGSKNWRRPVTDPRAKRLQRIFYVVCGLFALAVLWYGRTASQNTWREAIILILPIACVHLVRAAIERSVQEAHIVNDGAALRLFMDALANYSVIALALFSTAIINVYLIPWSFFFGAMLVLKELKFRGQNDVDFPESGLSKKRLTRADKRRLDRRDFLGNYMKSYFYILMGFAVIYACVAAINSSLGSAIGKEATAGTYPGLDAFWYAIRGFVLAASPEGHWPLIVLLTIQLFVFVPLTLYLLGTVFRSR